MTDTAQQGTSVPEIESTINRVFVYGTLKKGFGNHRILMDAKHLGDTRIYGYGLQHRGAFPVMYKEEFATGINASVFGEIYEITPDMLARMDILEGVKSNFYQRVLVNCYAQYGNCWAYVMQKPKIQYQKVISGIWRGPDSDTVDVIPQYHPTTIRETQFGKYPLALPPPTEEKKVAVVDAAELLWKAAAEATLPEPETTPTPEATI